MNNVVTEQLKRKYLDKALKMIRGNRSDAAQMGFKSDSWPEVASAKAEELIEAALDLVNADIDEMEAIRQERGVVYQEEPAKKRGRYMGVADDYEIENGDYVYKE